MFQLPREQPTESSNNHWTNYNNNVNSETSNKNKCVVVKPSRKSAEENSGKRRRKAATVAHWNIEEIKSFGHRAAEIPISKTKVLAGKFGQQILLFRMSNKF